MILMKLLLCQHLLHLKETLFNLQHIFRIKAGVGHSSSVVKMLVIYGGGCSLNGSLNSATLNNLSVIQR